MTDEIRKLEQACGPIFYLMNAVDGARVQPAARDYYGMADLSDRDRIAADDGADAYYNRPRRGPWLSALIGVLGVVLIAAWCAINGGC